MKTPSSKKRMLTPEEVAECTALKAIWMGKKKELGLTQETLADRLGMSQAGISQYLNAYNALNLEVAIEFSDALGVPISRFSRRLSDKAEQIARTREPEPIQAWSNIDELDEGYIAVPRLSAALSAGNGRQQEEEPDHKAQPQTFRRDWIERKGWKPENLYSVYADGNSMEPRIFDGDTLLVDVSSKRPKDGFVYAIRYAGETRVKRLFWTPAGGLIIHSDNPTHRPITITAEEADKLDIIGEVVWRASDKV